jgi:hypothetical protein
MSEGTERGGVSATVVSQRATRARRGSGLSETAPRGVTRETAVTTMEAQEPTARAEEDQRTTVSLETYQNTKMRVEEELGEVRAEEEGPGEVRSGYEEPGELRAVEEECVAVVAPQQPPSIAAMKEAQRSVATEKLQRIGKEPVHDGGGLQGHADITHEDKPESVWDHPDGSGEAPDHDEDDSPDSFAEDDSRVGDKHRIIVRVEPPETWHADWETWQAYLTTYCERTKQVLPVKETMSRAERNRRLDRTKKGMDESVRVPDGMDPYQRTHRCTHRCTHGWKKRRSRSEGNRPRQHVRLTNCPFRFVIQWNLEKRELQVKNGCFVHNHEVSKAAYETYPGVRGVDDPIVGARVEGMLAAGAKRSRIYDYLLEHKQNVIQIDVDNMVRGFSSAVSARDDNEATVLELAKFTSADTENIATVTETDAGETGVISLATAHMRRVFGRFSELLMVDCSHKTNRYADLVYP